MTFAELKIQPRRTLTTPTWTGLVNDGRTYAAWTLNVERLVPWRTLTGRQHLYLDHPVYLDFGQALPGYKPKLGERMRDLVNTAFEPCWINDKDAASVGLVDNDWVEVFNDNGVMVTRAAVSARVQRGTCMIYHSPERTLSVPKSQVRGGRRAGGHNSLTRTRINPVLLAGGQAQFTYGFNYWGPTGFNRDTVVVIKKLDRLEW
jgi:nitrate reductase alpha subunit